MTPAGWRLALALYQVENGKSAAQLDDLVPKYLSQLPVDPYSGQPFGYRIAREDEALPGAPGTAVQTVHAGQGILWSAARTASTTAAARTAAAWTTTITAGRAAAWTWSR